MAYNEVLFFTFSEAIAESLGLVPYRYRVSFQRQDFNVTPYEIAYAGDSPVVVSLSDSSDNIFETLLYQKYTFQLVFQKETWDKRFFDVSGDQDLRIQIDVDEGLGVGYRPYRFGFVQGGIREPHGPAPYIVEVSATCGLSLLKTRPLVDGNGRRLQGAGGFVSCVEVIRSALALTGLSLPLVTVDNLYEQAQLAVGQTVDGKAAEATDPLHKATIRAELLVDDEGNTINAEDALRLVLAPRMHRLCQNGGKWWTVRIPETAGGWNVWGNAPATSVKAREYQSVTLSAINTTTYAYDFHINPYINLIDSGDKKRNLTATGGFDSVTDSEVGIKITQNFGRSRGNLPNGDFSEVDNTGLPIGWFRNNLKTDEGYRGGLGSNVDPYRLILKGAGDEKYNNDTPFIGTEITYTLPPVRPGQESTSKPLKRTLKGQFRLTNVRAAKLIVVAIRKEVGGYVEYLLKGDGSWIRKPSRKDRVGILFHNTRDVNGVLVPLNNWQDFTQEMEPLSDVERLRIDFGIGEKLDVQASSPYPTTEYRYITLITGEDTQNVTGTSRVYVKPGATPREMLQVNLGDVPDSAGSDTHIGATLKQQSGYPATTLWYPPNANTQTAGGLALGATQLEIAAKLYAQQLMYPADSFEGPVYGRLKDGPLQVLRFQDLPKYVGNDTVERRLPHLITRYEHDLRLCQYSTINAQRLMIDAPQTALPTVKKYWLTPAGEVEYDYETEEAPLPPNLAGQQSLQEQLKAALPAIGVPLNQLGDISGHTVVDAGSTAIGAEIYNNSQLIGKVRSLFRKFETLDFP